ncbi:MAG: NAD(P)(+) transhydrogenase (Re/Si-specific) subunit beta, partial [bacterium]
MEIFREVGYIVSAFLFIMGIKYMGNPSTAIKGNIISLIGMAIAIICTFFYPNIILNNIWFVLVAIVLGLFMGTYFAQVVKFTEMPQMVSFFNGMGGLTIALIAIVEFSKAYMDKFFVISAGFSGVIGSISFVGSMLAAAKLWGFFEGSKKSVFLRIFNGVTLIAIISVYLLFINQPSYHLLILLFVLGGILGFSGVFPIGGADMPVVIALLNAFTGLAASIGGFALNNNAMIVSGTLVGASGTILTFLMAKAMNRSVFNIILGGFGSPTKESLTTSKGNIQEITPEDAAILLSYSKNVVIVPGYGMAAS